MSTITVYHENDATQVVKRSSNQLEIAQILKSVGVLYEQWVADEEVSVHADPKDVIGAYITKVDQLMVGGGYTTVDVISMHPEHPDKDALRQKFLQEHTHSEDEVRLFAKGQGLFSLHLKHHVYEVLCCEGDLISVPANTPHWFDMGSEPSFLAVRFFCNPEGWVAQYTGSDIAQRFSRFEALEEAVC